MGLVIIGHRSSKYTFGANNKMLRPGSGSRIPRCRPKSLSMSIHTVEFEKVEHLYHLHYLYYNHLIITIKSLHVNPHRGIRKGCTSLYKENYFVAWFCHIFQYCVDRDPANGVLGSALSEESTHPR